MKHQEYLKKLAEGEWLELPSGLEVRVKPVDALILISGNRYSSEFQALISEHINGVRSKNTKPFEEMTAEERTAEAVKSRQVQEAIAENAVVYPKLVRGEPTAEDEFPMAALDYYDLQYLFSLVGLPQAQLASFCQKQKERLESLRSFEVASDNPVETAGAAVGDLIRDEPESLPAIPVDGKAKNAK